MSNPWNPPGPRFVGRESELAKLHSWVAHVSRGDSLVVVVHGAPGMGKTRLLEQFERELRMQAGFPCLVVRQELHGCRDTSDFLADLVAGMRNGLEKAIAAIQARETEGLPLGLRQWRRLERAKRWIRRDEAGILKRLADLLPAAIPSVGSQLAAGVRALSFLLEAANRTASPAPSRTLRKQLVEMLQRYSDWASGLPGAFVLMLDQWDEIRKHSVLRGELTDAIRSIVRSLRSDYRVCLVLALRSDSLGAMFPVIHNRATTKKIVVPLLRGIELEDLLRNPYPVGGLDDGPHLLADDEAVGHALESCSTEAPLLDTVEMLSEVWDEASEASLNYVSGPFTKRVLLESRRHVVRSKAHAFLDRASESDERFDTEEATLILRALSRLPDHSSITASTVASFLPPQRDCRSAVVCALECLSTQPGCRLLYRLTRDPNPAESAAGGIFMFRHGLIQEDLHSALELGRLDPEMGKLLAAAGALCNAEADTLDDVLSICSSILDRMKSLSDVDPLDATHLVEILSLCLEQSCQGASSIGRVVRVAYYTFALGAGGVIACAQLLVCPNELARQAAHDLCGCIEGFAGGSEADAGDEVERRIAASRDARDWLIRMLSRKATSAAKAEAIRLLMAVGAEDAVPALVGCLKEPSPLVWRQAVRALAMIGSQEAVSELLDALGTLPIDARDEALRLIARVGSSRAISWLLDVLRNSGLVPQRTAVASALAEVETPETVSGLGPTTKEEIPGARREALETLAKDGSSQAVARLRTTLQLGAVGQRAEAVTALGTIGTEEAVDALADALSDGSTRVRRVAVAALASIGSRRAVGCLLEALGDPNPGVRREAISGLSRAASPDAMLGLLHALRDRNSVDVRLEAADALSRIDRSALIHQSGSGDDHRSAESHSVGTVKVHLDEVTSSLSRSLDDTDEPVRVRVVGALAHLGGEEGIGGLTQALRNKSTVVRREAAMALARFTTESAVSGLSIAMADPDETVQMAAIRSMGATGSPIFLPLLSAGLKDEDPDVRREAATSLGSLGCPDAIPSLVRALGDSDPDVQRAAISALESTGSSSGVCPGLLAAVSAPNAEVRKEAIGAIARIGDWKDIRQLLQTLSAATADVRREAVDTLSAIGTPDAFYVALRVLEGPAADVDAEGPLGIAWSETKDAERILLIAVKHENTDIRVLSVAALGAIASESDAAAAVVLDSLSDDSAVVRREGIVWLSKIGSLEALRALLGALTDSATEVRRASVLGLGHAGLVEAVPGLAAALAADRSSEVRADAASALGAVGEACAAPDLLKALEDPSEAVARAALNALRCLGPQNVVDYLRGRSE